MLTHASHAAEPSAIPLQQAHPYTIKVHKYGGTSVGDVERIRKVASRIARAVHQGHKVAVTVSAMGRSTDQLIALAKEITARPHRRELDMLMATGEQQSMALLCMALHDIDIKARSFTGAQAGFLTDSFSGEAQILDIDPQPLLQAFAEVDVCVVAGFQGADEQGMLTTLGRGGSDTTAVAIAAALETHECSIFTDTEGVYTTDPHVVPHARKLEQLDYEEMIALAALGARVLHPRSVWYARQHQVVIHVRSSFSYNTGTFIRNLSHDKEASAMRTDKPVTGVTLDDSQSRINLFNVPDTPGTAAAIFERFAQAGISVDMVIQGIRSDDDASKQQMAFIVSRDRSQDASDILQPLLDSWGTHARLDNKVAKLSLVGIALGSNPTIASIMFSTLAAIGINVEMISTSEVRVSAIIPADRGKEALTALHDAFDMGGMGDAGNTEA